MRAYIYNCMDVPFGEALPPSYDERPFHPLPLTDPVRFVWEKTTRKSAHNARMKARVVSGLMASRDTYPLGPARKSEKLRLEALFEQVFRTLRAKYAAQNPGSCKPRKTSEEQDEARRRGQRRWIRRKVVSDV